MSRLNLRLFPGEQDVCRESRQEAELLLEDFLDHVCAPLVGVVSLGVRRGLRAEVRGHLESLIAEYEYQGKSPEDAARLALQEFGEPWQMGRDFLHEWCQGVPDVHPVLLTRMAFWRAFGFFGISTMLVLFLVEQYALGTPHESLRTVILLMAALAPVTAGALTGLTALPRVGRGTAYALLVLILDSSVTGILLWPQPECLYFALFQILFWLPVGCLAAVIAAAVVRSLRRKRFLKYVH